MKNSQLIYIAIFYLSMAILYFAFLPNAVAQTHNEPDVVKAVYDCKVIENAEERLACYDQAVGRLEAAQRSGDIVTISKSEVEKVEKDAFGFNIPSLPKLGKIFGGGDNKKTRTSQTASSENDLSDESNDNNKDGFNLGRMKSVELQIRKTDTFGYNKTRFFFSNGQVWEQVDSAKVRIPKIKNDNPNFAHISKASLGSFMLRINGKGRAVRVKRVR